MARKRDIDGFVIRFGCGGTLGFVAGLYIAARSAVETPSELARCLLICVIAVGLLSAVFGDRFWNLFIGWCQRR